jgi:hypothetical protein
MAIVPKLDGKVVNLAKNNKVVGYASGKNLESFIQFINNGMYTLSLNKGKAANEDKEDDDDVVEKVVDDSASKRIDSWDPFNSVVAPEGYCFFGKLSFLCLVPASAYYAKTLSSTPRQTTLVEEKKMMGRGAMKKEISTQKSVERNIGRSDRGMSLATKASFGFMAQNEDNAVQHHHDMHWATLTKMIDTEQRMIDVKMKLMDSNVIAGGSGEQLRMSVLIMMDKIDKWNNELGLLGKEKRVSNPIVGRVLEHAARSMGIVVAPAMMASTKPTGNLKNDDDYFVASVLEGKEGDESKEGFEGDEGDE